MRRLQQLLSVLFVALFTTTSIASPPLAPPPIRIPRVVPKVRAPAPPPPAAPPPVAKPATPAPVAKPAATTAAPQVHVRDWKASPAIVEHVPQGQVFAVSDLHGHYEGAVKLLKGNNLVSGDIAHPESMAWTGKNATLVVVGDFVNKGNGSVKMIDMLRSIQKGAAAAGGKVIVTLGNHEADFIHTPDSERAMRDGSNGRHGVGNDLVKAGQSPQDVAAGIDEAGRGAWLRELPFAAKVGDSFFVHSGNTNGQSKDGLESSIQKNVTSGGFGHDDVIGEHATPLGADNWKKTAKGAPENAKQLGVKRIVMGHIPKALEGEGDIARTADGSLVKIDTGFGNDSAPARLLEIGPKGRLTSYDDAGKSSSVQSWE